MKFRLKKKDGGGAVVTLVRPDGSSTSGRLGAGDFGAVHDLAHFAAETTLGLRSGFLGLVAQGWSIADFARPGAARRLPAEALVAECVVGQLTNVILAGGEPDAAEFNEACAAAVAGVRPGAPAPVVDATVLAALVGTLRALVGRYRALPAGGTLELDVAFNPATRPSPAAGPVPRAASPTPPARGA